MIDVRGGYQHQHRHPSDATDPSLSSLNVKRRIMKNSGVNAAARVDTNRRVTVGSTQDVLPTSNVSPAPANQAQAITVSSTPKRTSPPKTMQSHGKRKTIHGFRSGASNIDLAGRKKYHADSTATGRTPSAPSYHSATSSFTTSRPRRSQDRYSGSELKSSVTAQLGGENNDSQNIAAVELVPDENGGRRKTMNIVNNSNHDKYKGVIVSTRIGAVKTWEYIRGETTSKAIAMHTSAANAYVKIHDEQWRRLWRGVHLPLVSRYVPPANRRRRSKKDKVPKHIDAPKSKVTAPSPAENMERRKQQPDMPKTAFFNKLIKHATRGPAQKQQETMPDEENDQSQQIVCPPVIIREQTNHTSLQPPSPLPPSGPYAVLFSTNQPTVPLYPLLICFVTYLVYRCVIVKRIFTFQNRTALARKLCVFRYGGNSKQFLVGQDDLDEHIRQFRNKNDARKKQKLADVSINGEDGITRDKNCVNDAGRSKNCQSNNHEGRQSQDKIRSSQTGTTSNSNQYQNIEQELEAANQTIELLRKQIDVSKMRASKYAESNALLSKKCVQITEESNIAFQRAERITQENISLRESEHKLAGEKAALLEQVEILEVTNKRAKAMEEEHEALKETAKGLEAELEEMDNEMEQLLAEIERKNKHEGKELDVSRSIDPSGMGSLTDDEDEDSVSKVILQQLVASLQSEKDTLQATIHKLNEELNATRSLAASSQSDSYEDLGVVSLQRTRSELIETHRLEKDELIRQLAEKEDAMEDANSTIVALEEKVAATKARAVSLESNLKFRQHVSVAKDKQIADLRAEREGDDQINSLKILNKDLLKRLAEKEAALEKSRATVAVLTKNGEGVVEERVIAIERKISSDDSNPCSRTSSPAFSLRGTL